MLALSKALLAARSTGAALSVADYEELMPSRADAFKVQEELAETQGPIGGWKVAVDPQGHALYAPMYAADIRENGARFFEKDGKPLGVECELAFRLAKDLPEVPATEAELMDAIEGLYAVIEFIGGRIEDLDKAPVDLKLADNLANAGFVVGQKIAEWDLNNLTDVDLKLIINEGTVIDTRVTNVLGAPVDLLKEAVRAAGNHCGGFKAGQYVTTGSLSGCTFYPAGTSIRVEYPAFDASVSAVI